MSEKGILDTIKEYEIPNLTLDDLWSLVNVSFLKIQIKQLQFKKIAIKISCNKNDCTQNQLQLKMIEIKISCIQKDCNQKDRKPRLHPVRTRKLWKIKTTIKQYISLFDDVTKQIVVLLTSNLSNHLFNEMGLFTLHS